MNIIWGAVCFMLFLCHGLILEACLVLSYHFICELTHSDFSKLTYTFLNKIYGGKL